MIIDERAVISLDGQWDFVPDPQRRLTASRLPDGHPITVPGAWEAQLAAPYGVVRGWYRRAFRVPDDWDRGTLVLRFGAAMTRATVWLDGTPVGRNEDGYVPFEVEAGPVRAGFDHDLVVEVENPLNVLSDYPAFSPQAIRAAAARLGGEPFDDLPHGKQTWYTSTSGLIGSVEARLAPDPRLAALLVLPDLGSGRAVVRWRLAGARGDDPATLQLSITAPDGEVVADASVDARAGSTWMVIPDPVPWDLSQPALYRVDARLHRGGGGATHPTGEVAEDHALVRFGMRSIAVREGSILLNGRPIYVRGALDQDFWPEGRSNPPSRSALEAQAALAREMGLNLLRCHVKVPDPAYLDVADDAGLLLWCELPSWTRLDARAAGSARRTLERMVETMGSHPSVVAWTVINEEWGADLRHSARDRRWVRTAVETLRVLDPTRLIVDNSASETGHEPSFHVRTDLSDFHVYRSMPDGLPRWRAIVEDYARWPAWLWSPYGDAAPTGNEALILSEFGGWGLPRPSAVRIGQEPEPWWWSTGETFRRPAELQRRFREQRLDRLWPDLDALADATQWQQFHGLTGQIRELRRHPSISGYVITQLADTAWEANGLLDMGRGRKVFHEALREVNAPDVLFVDLPRADLWGGERLHLAIGLASHADHPEHVPEGGGSLAWVVNLAGGAHLRGELRFGEWPNADARIVAHLALTIPQVDRVTCAELRMTATAALADRRAVYRQPIVIVPSHARRSTRPSRVGVVDRLGIWSIEGRLEALGHAIVPPGDSDLVVSADVDQAVDEDVSAGRSLLFLARSRDAIAADLSLARRVRVEPRRREDDVPPPERPWDGDWSSVYAWAMTGVVPGLPDGGLLGDAHREIFPDHVLDGLDVAAAPDGVEAGIFSGWVHAPAALLARFPHGSGRITATTFRLAPEDGPIATALLEELIQRSRPPTGRPVSP